MKLVTYMNHDIYEEELLQFASKDYCKKEKLEATCVDNGVILPLKKSEPGGPLMGYGGVLNQNGEYVLESAQIGKGDTAPRFIGKYEYDSTQEKCYDETVIYIGAFPPHWGHFLVDMSYRFWYFEKSAVPYRIAYCSEHDEIAGVYLKFLSLLGISEDRLFRVTVPSRFKQIIVPEPGYMACDYYTTEYKSVFEKMVSNLPKLTIKSYEKIYLSRGHFGDAKSKEIGEKNIEENFINNGYHILYMEELSLGEQIFYINNAKKVAALSGTLCHNIVFAGSDTELIILNKTHIINTHQILINQMMDIKVTYVDVYVEPFKTFPVSYGGGPFLLDGRKLISFFEQNQMVYYKERDWIRLQNRVIYLKMCIGIYLYKKYEKLYYRLCKHKCIIGMLRKIRQVCTD